MKPFALLGLASAVLASPLLEPILGPLLGDDPWVKIQNGTVVGSRLAGVDSFLGIPFAEPPVGNLRLRRPVAYNSSFGTVKTQAYAPSCISTTGGVNSSTFPQDVISLVKNSPLGNIVADQSEDCLYLNVQRPSTAIKGDKLPVVIWIYGGAFQFGSTSTYNAQAIVTRSILLKTPVIYVSMAYRLAGFGWMPGKEMQKDGNSNIGLHDQRLAMMWVQENIADFGGDPDHVVIWGESAGAISAYAHTIIDDGDNTYKGKPMFHGAVMNSGNMIPTRDIDSPKAQATYDMISKAAGCDGADDSLECLRGLSTEDFTTAVNYPDGTFSYTSVSLPFLPRPDPLSRFYPASPETVNFANGGYARVPVIVGDQEDEGTLFSTGQTNISTTQDLIDYFSTVFFPGTPLAYIETLVNAYPDDLADGSPFRTNDTNSIYGQYKRLAAILGDVCFTMTRRHYLETMSTRIPMWSYLNSYLYGTPILGTFHGADVLVLYGTVPTTYQSPQLPIDYYISFFNFLDPNVLYPLHLSSNCTSSLFWPTWDGIDRTLMHFQDLNTTSIRDDFRSLQYAAIQLEVGKLQA